MTNANNLTPDQLRRIADILESNSDQPGFDFASAVAAMEAEDMQGELHVYSATLPFTILARSPQHAEALLDELDNDMAQIVQGDRRLDVFIEPDNVDSTDYVEIAADPEMFMPPPKGTPVTTIRIKRQMAEWREDAIQVALPAEIDPTDQVAVEAWAKENYELLYLDTQKNPRPIATLDWEDEFVSNVDLDDTYIVEVFPTDV